MSSLLLYLFGASDDNLQAKQCISKSSYEETRGYKICKRELTSLKKFAKYVDTEKLESNYITLQHLHFFRIGEPSDVNYVEDNCSKNNFSNFGFSFDSRIICNEKIEDYKSCSSTIYNSTDLRTALDWLLGDFKEVKYSFLEYNCQAFAYQVLDGYKYIHNKTTENIFLDNNKTESPKCIVSPAYSISQKNILKKLKDAISSDNKKEHKIFLPENLSIRWEDNPFYHK